MRSLIVMVATVILAGCATTTANRPGPDDDPTRKCWAATLDDPRLAPLLPKVGSVKDSTGVTIAMLADKSKPATEAELNALKLWGDIRIQCLDAGKGFRAQYAPPGYDAVFSRHQTGLVLLTARLYANDITYGQFNAERQQLARERDASMQEHSRRANEIAAQEDAAARAAALQMFQHQQMLNQMRQPRTTNCTTFGGVVRCTEY